MSIGDVVKQIFDCNEIRLNSQKTEEITEKEELVRTAINQAYLGLYDQVESYEKIGSISELMESLKSSFINKKSLLRKLDNNLSVTENYGNKYAKKILDSYKIIELNLAKYISAKKDLVYAMNNMTLFELKSLIDEEINTNPQEYGWIKNLRENTLKYLLKIDTIKEALMIEKN